jgi:hypothetical protein
MNASLISSLFIEVVVRLRLSLLLLSFAISLSILIPLIYINQPFNYWSANHQIGLFNDRQQTYAMSSPGLMCRFHQIDPFTCALGKYHLRFVIIVAASTLYSLCVW